MKYKVEMCYEKWQYYTIEIEAESRGLATAKAEELWADDPGGTHADSTSPFIYDADKDDGNGATVTDCREVEPTITARD